MSQWALDSSSPPALGLYVPGAGVRVQAVGHGNVSKGQTLPLLLRRAALCRGGKPRPLSVTAWKRLACALILLGLVTACAETSQVRQIRPDEWRIVGAAFVPLLRKLNLLGTGQAVCEPAVGVREGQAKMVAVGPGSFKETCILLELYVTEGAIASLSPRELQAILAHELGHLRLGHQGVRETRGEAAVGRGMAGGATMRIYRTVFTPQQEADANRFAAQVLASLAGERPREGCLSLAAVFESVTRDASGWSEWLSRHPVSERHPQEIRRLCEGEPTQ